MAAPTQAALPACPGCEGCQAGPARQGAAASTFLPAGEAKGSLNTPRVQIHLHGWLWGRRGWEPQNRAAAAGMGEVPGIITTSPAALSDPGPVSSPAAPCNAPPHRRRSSQEIPLLPAPTTLTQPGPTGVLDPHRRFGRRRPGAMRRSRAAPAKHHSHRPLRTTLCTSPGTTPGTAGAQIALH